MTDFDMKRVEGDLSDEDVYTAVLTLRSVGNNPSIIPELRFSHQLGGDLNDRIANNQIPFSFIAMMKIAESINKAMVPVDDNVIEELPDDPEEAAKMLSAMVEAKQSGPAN